MAKIHIVLQGKGGVGKSFAAWVAANFLQHKGHDTKNIDIDPQNASFAVYKGLNVEHINVIEDKEVNTRLFDKLIEVIAPLSDDAVIDSGSNSFFQLANYIISNKVPQLIRDLGHEMVVHTPVTGGPAMLDTLSSFSQLAQQLPPEAKIVVWLNPFWGPVASDDGKTFEQMKAYKENKDRVAAIINIPKLKAETYGQDLTQILKDGMTFKEAIDSPSLGIMTRQRLKLIRDELYSQLDASTVL